MSTCAKTAVTPVSHEGQNGQQHRELRNLVLATTPEACDAELAPDMKSLLEVALEARTDRTELKNTRWKFSSTTLWPLAFPSAVRVGR